MFKPEVEASYRRNIALFTIALSTTNRGNELTRTFMQRISQAAKTAVILGLNCNGVRRKDGANSFITTASEEVRLASCPIKGVEQHWVAVTMYAR